jgi:hypothetical protein
LTELERLRVQSPTNRRLRTTVTITRDDAAPALDVEQVIRDIAGSIGPAFVGVLSPRTVERCVSESLQQSTPCTPGPSHSTAPRSRLRTWSSR